LESAQRSSDHRRRQHRRAAQGRSESPTDTRRPARVGHWGEWCWVSASATGGCCARRCGCRQTAPAASVSAHSRLGLVAGRLGRLATADLAGPGLGGQLDGVPGTPERGRVAQVQIGQGLDGHVVEQSAGGDVDAFGDLGAMVAKQLGASSRPLVWSPVMRSCSWWGPGSRPCGRTGPIRS
jgi:hypothetical protein